MKIECPLCNDTEFITYTAEDETIWARDCECKEQKVIRRMFNASGLTSGQQKITLEDFKTDSNTKPMFNMVKKYINEFNQIITGETAAKGMALIGKVGTGKTMLMCAITNSLLNKKIPTMLISSPELIADLLSAKFNGGGEAFENKMHRLMTVDVLILDDVAKEKTTEWVQTQYFRIVDARYNAQLATLFTSNYMFDEIGDKLGEAVGSRLFGLTRDRQVIVDTIDYRIHGNARPKMTAEQAENFYL